MMNCFDSKFRLNYVTIHISAVLFTSDRGEIIASDISMNVFCPGFLHPYTTLDVGLNLELLPGLTVKERCYMMK